MSETLHAVLFCSMLTISEQVTSDNIMVWLTEGCELNFLPSYVWHESKWRCSEIFGAWILYYRYGMYSVQLWLNNMWKCVHQYIALFHLVHWYRIFFCWWVAIFLSDRPSASPSDPKGYVVRNHLCVWTPASHLKQMSLCLMEGRWVWVRDLFITDMSILQASRKDFKVLSHILCYSFN
jgi:hypothetical protein